MKSGSFDFEDRIMIEIERVESDIRALTQEKLALQRQLMKARKEKLEIRDVSRINSINRVLIENKILKALAESTGGLSTKRLLKEVKEIEFHIKDSTFRSHLHRLKQKGQITSGARRGFWIKAKED